jgi:hypothetical protein
MNPPKKPLHPLVAFSFGVGPLLVILILMEVFPFRIPWAPDLAFITRYGAMSIAAGAMVVGAMVGIVACVPSYLFIKRWRAKHDRYDRWTKKRCIQCNYDVRAQNPGDNCPECGTQIPKST